MSSVIGKVARKTDETDIFVALGILLFFNWNSNFKKIGISLSTSGGALIMGLIFDFYIHVDRLLVTSLKEQHGF
ncbi:MAG: hypothetical protein ACLRQX_04340 [Turicibacter sanguinis]